jgi:hypothetical protein
MMEADSTDISRDLLKEEKIAYLVGPYFDAEVFFQNMMPS